MTKLRSPFESEFWRAAFVAATESGHSVQTCLLYADRAVEEHRDRTTDVWDYSGGDLAPK